MVMKALRVKRWWSVHSRLRQALGAARQRAGYCPGLTQGDKEKLMDEIYGELENGLIFLLTPQWLLDYEADEIETFKENNE